LIKTVHDNVESLVKFWYWDRRTSNKWNVTLKIPTKNSDVPQITIWMLVVLNR
jgi:hypothetical protein